MNTLNVYKSLFALVLVLMISVSGCKKEEVLPPAYNFEFTLLDQDADTIQLSKTTNLRAEAVGEGLTYSWDKDIGILMGEGAQIQFLGCCLGDHHVTCTVRDSHGNEASKTVSIWVKE